VGWSLTKTVVPLASRVLLILGAAVLSGAGEALLGNCGPFTDTANDAFCPFVLEIFYLGITTGTMATTFSPSDNVSRLQMAAFLSRTVDRALLRGSRRAALSQFWTPANRDNLTIVTLGFSAPAIRSDGADVWVPTEFSDQVFRVRGNDAKLLETWTGATGGSAVLSAQGRVFVLGKQTPGRLYLLDPSQPAGVVTTVASNLADSPTGIAFDGARIWTANQAGKSVSIVTRTASPPWTVTTVTAGFSNLTGILWDGGNIWTTDALAGTLLKLDASGAILQTVTTGPFPSYPIYDGANIWVPNATAPSVTVVRASNGAVLETLTGNGMDTPITAAFDGQRILVTNEGNDSVSLWKAADLSPLGSVSFGSGALPQAACSDGTHFWIMLNATGLLARF